MKEKISKWYKQTLFYIKHPKQLYLKIKPYLTFKFIVSFGVSWMIFTGWSWLFIALGPTLGIPWMTKIGIGYQFFAWQPWFIEKPFVFALGIWIHKKLFNHDIEYINNKILENNKKPLQRKFDALKRKLKK